MKPILLVLMSALTLASIPGAPLGAEVAEVRRSPAVQVVERVMPSVVNISTETVIQYRDPFESLLREYWGPYYGRPRENTETYYSLGSGVIIAEAGYILTNYHVVRRASRIWITLAESDKERHEAELVTYVEEVDLALLKIMDLPGRRFQALTFAEENDLLVGESVLALGNPFGLGGSVSRGILSSKTRRTFEEGPSAQFNEWIQTDAAINPGNSGGPLVNLEGRLIGLNVAIHREGQGIGFAVPVTRINEALSLMFTPEHLASLWFGARLIPQAGALEVVSLDEDSPADAAGLKPGDRITRLNDRPVRGLIGFQHDLLEHPHREARLTYEREGATREARLQLLAEADFFNAAYLQARLGIRAQPLTPELAREFGFGDSRGLLVSEVTPGSAARKVGLDSGMIIEGIGGTRVEDLTMAGKLIRNHSPGDRVTLNVLYPVQLGRRHFLRSQAVQVEIQ